MRSWRAPLAILAAAGMLIAGTTISLAGTGQHQASGQHRSGTSLSNAGLRNVGPGWVLTQYTTAPPGGGGPSGPMWLYLISPSGTRYQLARWPNNQTGPQLIDWSPDGSRALFEVFSAHPYLEQMTLATRAVRTFSLPADWTPVGYTLPSGQDIVASTVAGNEQALASFDLTGRLVRKLGPSGDGRVLYTPDGTALITAAAHGVRLESSGGTLIRLLNVPHTAANTCSSARWWNARTVLVRCVVPNQPTSRLWLVPVSGQQPVALTPQRAANSRDLGDLDAWQLRSGLYLQASGPCGVVYVFRQAPNGSIQLVHVPHTVGDDSRVLTADSSRLLVDAPTSCEGSNSLFWFNPATGTEQWLVRTTGNVIGVAGAIPFYSRENAQP